MCSCGSYNPENFQLYMVRLAHQIQCIHISPILNEDLYELSTTFVLHEWHLNQFRHITKPLSNIIMPFVFVYYRTRSAQSEKAHSYPLSAVWVSTSLKELLSNDHIPLPCSKMECSLTKLWEDIITFKPHSVSQDG